MRIVVDTNVIASAIFFGGKPYQLLRYIMEDRVDVVASKAIVDEYEEIVLRLKQKYPFYWHEDPSSRASIQIRNHPGQFRYPCQSGSR